MTRTDASPLPLAALVSLVLSLGVFLMAGGFASGQSGLRGAGALPLPVGQAPAYAPLKSKAAHDALPPAPLAFERSARGAYRTRGAGYELFIDSHGSQMVLRGDSGASLRTELLGGNRSATARTDRRLETVVNRYGGGDSSSWRAGIATFGRVTYRGVYPGIDVRYHGNGGQLEYDFVLRPQADPSEVALGFHGASKLRAARNGDLLIGVGKHTVRQDRPVSYQRIGGRRVPVASKFVVDGRQVSFELGRYDRARSLVIDPTLVFGDYIGGTGADNGGRIAIDSSGNMYLAATSASSSIQGGATVKHAKSSGKDAFVMKIHPDGVREWITYLGGAQSDQANDIGVDGSGRPVIVGETKSTLDFPVTASAFEPSYSGGDRDAFITALNADGSIRWSTYFGSSEADSSGSVSVTPSGNVYAALNLFTVSAGNPIPPMKGYVYVFNSSGASATAYQIGDFTSDDTADAVAVMPGCDATNCEAYITGHYLAPDPDGAAGTTVRAGYIYRWDFDAGAMVWFTEFTYPTDLDGNGSLEYPGGEWPTAIAVDPGGNPVVAGTTKPGNGHSWAFLVRFGKEKDPVTGEVIIDSPFVQFSNPPLNGDSFAGDVATDAEGNIYLTGTTLATNGSGLDAVQPHSGGAYDASVLKYFPDGPPVKVDPADPLASHPSARIVWATYLGGADNDFGVGIVTDGKGGTYVSGEAGSNFIPSPKTQALAPTPDAFVVRLETNAPTITEGPSGTVKPRDHTFKYSSGETGATYECRMISPSSPSPPFGSCGGISEYKALADGDYRFEVKSWDSGGTGNGSVTARAFKIDTSPQAAFSIAPNPALVGRAVTFDASASAASTPITKYEWDLDGNGSFETNSGTTATVTQIYPSAGAVTVGLRITDGETRTGTATNVLQVNSAGGPGLQFGVTINDGAQFTNDPDVTVTSTFPSFTTSLLFSNDGGFGKAQTFTPKKETKWKLDSSGPERLPKTIYVRFLTGSVASTSFQDDIILDETPPKVDAAEIDAVRGAAPAAVYAAKRKLRRFKVKMKATDKTSGVNKVQVTANKRKPGKALKYKRKFVVKAAKRPKWVRARDRAGNWSKWKKAR